MKINIQVLEGTTNPAPTTLTYTKALWRKNHVVLVGTATCQGKNLYIIEFFLIKSSFGALKLFIWGRLTWFKLSLSLKTGK